MQLGGLVQTAGAFDSVQTALSFFITVYRDLAEWRAVIAAPGRIRSLDRDCTRFRRRLHRCRRTMSYPPSRRKRGSRSEGLSVHLPTGAPLVATEDLFIEAGERALVTGPSGCGKSTFFRAIAGAVAVRHGHRQGAAWRQADDAAAAAVFPG